MITTDMSSYRRQTKNPKTGNWEEAFWVDDYFGRHQYGVLFPSDIGAGTWEDMQPLSGLKRHAYSPEVVKLETKD